MIASDCDSIHRNVQIVMQNRLKGRLSKRGFVSEVYIRENYGKSKQIRFVTIFDRFVSAVAGILNSDVIR